MDSSPIASNTAVFFSSDHGDYSGDWRSVEKYPCALDDVLTRVPLIARIPGGVANMTIAAPVAMFDMMPTILLVLAYTRFLVLCIHSR